VNRNRTLFGLISTDVPTLPRAAGPPALAYVTQTGWELNLVNEAGIPSRAWIDYPGHIWVQNWNEGAIYSPDGMIIQFNHGTVWQRVVW